MCPVCDIEGHKVEDCPQLPMIKDTMWVNQRQEQWKPRPYEQNNQQHPQWGGNVNNYAPVQGNFAPPSTNFAPPLRPPQGAYIPIHQRPKHPNARFNNLKISLRKTIIDGNKNIIDGVKEHEKSLDRNFDRLHE